MAIQLKKMTGGEWTPARHSLPPDGEIKNHRRALVQEAETGTHDCP